MQLHAVTEEFDSQGEAALSDAGPVVRPDLRRGRGAGLNMSGRFEPLATVSFDDGWDSGEDLPPLKTTVPGGTGAHHHHPEHLAGYFLRPLHQPLPGCEHGCIYCFARPTHAFMGLSPGLDFETRLFAKPNAAELLERELSRPNYQPRTIAIAPTPILTSRWKSNTRSCARCWRCWTDAIIRSASSPNPRS